MTNFGGISFGGDFQTVQNVTVTDKEERNDGDLTETTHKNVTQTVVDTN